jgi:hypothetical protein
VGWAVLFVCVLVRLSTVHHLQTSFILQFTRNLLGWQVVLRVMLSGVPTPILASTFMLLNMQKGTHLSKGGGVLSNSAQHKRGRLLVKSVLLA